MYQQHDGPSGLELEHPVTRRSRSAIGYSLDPYVAPESAREIARAYRPDMSVSIDRAIERERENRAARNRGAFLFGAATCVVASLLGVPALLACVAGASVGALIVAFIHVS